MIISRIIEEQVLNIQIHGEILQQVEHYQYLGHIITNDGRCETEVKKRIGIAKSTFNDMRKILTSKQITNKLKMRIIKCNIYINVWLRNMDNKQTIRRQN